MDTIKITGIERKISRLGLGTMIFAPNKKKLCFSILDTFVANGGTTIDTAEVYGDPEEHGYSEITIGMWLQERGRREDIVLISKDASPTLASQSIRTVWTSPPRIFTPQSAVACSACRPITSTCGFCTVTMRASQLAQL